MILPNAANTMSPCKGCEIRAEGCHAICMWYAAYREELEDKRQHRKQELMKGCVLAPWVKNKLYKRLRKDISSRTGGIK